MGGPPRVAVCVVTLRRPEGLRRLLDGLGRLTFRRAEPPDLKVIVVDNDSAGSARVVCEEVAEGYPWPLEYRVEPRRGIPYARNTAVATAGAVDFVAFVDDDEVPEPLWLDKLLFVQRSYGADVVAGPALAYFDGSVPDWIEKGKLFGRARFPTGHRLRAPFVATNNVLVRSRLLAAVGAANGGKVFDERYAMSGGSDTNLFMRAEKAGYAMVWADEAVVHDRIPASRANAGWILQRAYRFGNTLALCERDIDSSAGSRFVRVAKAGRHVAQGLLLALPSAILGRHALVKALRRVCLGVGMLAGVAGLRYEEYRKTHGT